MAHKTRNTTTIVHASVVDTPCSSRQQKPTRRERRSADAEVDPGDMIENLPKTFLSFASSKEI